MNARVMLAGMFILVAGIEMANGDEPPDQGAIVKNGEDVIVIEGAADLPTPRTGLPSLPWSGTICVNYREWQALPYIWRYCTNRRQGYEAQVDEYYKGTRPKYRGSKLLDCDSNDGWKPSNGNMKTYYCP